MGDLSKSPYRHLLDGRDFRRWFDNVKRGSVVTAHEWLHRMGYVYSRFCKSPKQIASMNSKDAANFILEAQM